MDKTDEEFVKEQLASRQASKKTAAEKVQRSKVRRKPKRVYPWQRLSNWAAVVMFIPVLLTCFLFYSISRARAYFGAESLDWLSHQNITPETKEILARSGMDWVPGMLVYYNNRYIIIAVMFTIAIVISGLLLVLDVMLEKRRNKRNEEVKDDE